VALCFALAAADWLIPADYIWPAAAKQGSAEEDLGEHGSSQSRVLLISARWYCWRVLETTYDALTDM
jgi:hypothetical protein